MGDVLLHGPTGAILTSRERFHDPPLGTRAFDQVILLQSLSDFFCNFSHAQESRADRMNELAGLAGPGYSTWIISWNVKNLILLEIEYQRVPDLGWDCAPPDHDVDLARDSGLSCMEHIRDWKSWNSSNVWDRYFQDRKNPRHRKSDLNERPIDRRWDGKTTDFPCHEVVQDFNNLC